jgi:hypothetical protein
VYFNGLDYTDWRNRMGDESVAVAGQPLSGEELLNFFQKEPTKLQLAETITKLADENERLRRELSVYLLGEQVGAGKTALEWINNARLAAAHLALTELGHKYDSAAAILISLRPAITKLLKENRRAKRNTVPFTDKERIIQLRKNFNSGRATKNRDALVAFKYARKAISRCSENRVALGKLAVALILAIDFSEGRRKKF